MTQRTLFDLDLKAPAQRHSDTSVAAAESIQGRAASLRAVYLDWLRQQGEAGATDDEAQAALGMGGSTQRPRRIECQKMGLVKDSGKRRKTVSGKPATVWVAS